MAVILSRVQGLIVPLLSTHGTATLLSKDGGEVKVPLAPLLGASTLLRSTVDESHLHPGIHGPLILSFAVTVDVLMSVRDLLSVGEANLMEENIEEVIQVLNSLGVGANLSQCRINNESEHVATNEEDIKLEFVFETESHEETEGGVNEAMDNLLNVASNEEDIKQEMVFESARGEETLSEVHVSNVNEAMDNSLKECYVNIEKIVVGSFNQRCPNISVENPYNRSCSFPGDLETHTRILKGKKPHACTICNSTFSYPSDLRIHYRIHTGEKPFTCKICSLSFSQKGNLRSHGRIHTGEKPFGCKICNTSFSQKGSLRIHERIHTGDKQFKCKICSYSSVTLGELRLHIRIHTGEKPYSCKVCSYSCSNSSDLKKHSRIHTGEKPFTCETCNSSFTHPSTLRQHKKNSH